MMDVMFLEDYTITSDDEDYDSDEPTAKSRRRQTENGFERRSSMTLRLHKKK